MKKNLLVLSLSFISFFVFASSPHQDHVKVNTEVSTIQWKGSKIYESHEGSISLKSGKLVLDHGKLVGGQFVIDMTTIVNTDIESEKGRSNLESHLKNEDFFDVENYNTSLLKITKVKLEEGTRSSYLISADLTIKGITHSIDFNADVKIRGANFLATANIKIDRTKWDITYGTDESLGDRMILNDIEFQIFLVSVK